MLAFENYSLNIILYHYNLLKALSNSFKLLLEYRCFTMLLVLTVQHSELATYTPTPTESELATHTYTNRK